MKKKVVIFGTRDLAELAKFYFEHDSDYETVAFTVDEEYRKEDSFLNLPLVPFEKVETLYSPKDHLIFVPMTQQKMGMIRKEKYLAAKKKGYSFATYISSKTTYYGTDVGENSFIFEDNTLQPFTKIGANVVLWSGNHIGHSSVIMDHCFLTSHVVISGHCTIEPHCFFGVNSTVRDYSVVREGSLVGMGAIINKETIPWGVYFGPRQTLKEGVKSLDMM